MTDRMLHCDYCGAEMGRAVPGLYGPRDVKSCGEVECERFARDEERGMAEEARERAEADDYERYR